MDVISKDGTKIVDIAVKKNYNREYCFAFIDLEDTYTAEKVLKRLNKYNFCGRNLRV